MGVAAERMRGSDNRTMNVADERMRGTDECAMNVTAERMGDGCGGLTFIHKSPTNFAA